MFFLILEFEKMMKQEHLLFDLERDQTKVTALDVSKKGYGNGRNLQVSDTEPEDDEKSD